MKRGRPSPGDLNVIALHPRRQRKHAHPNGMPTEQVIVWDTTISSMVPEFITEAAYPVLEEYCRHVCRARLLEEKISAVSKEYLTCAGGIERLDKMLAMADRETKAMIACARTLRLTPHAQMHARTAGRMSRDAPRGPAPWE